MSTSPSSGHLSGRGVVVASIQMAGQDARRPADAPTWRVQQMLVDPEMINDWVAEFGVDVAASRAAQQPVLWLRRIGAFAT